MSTDLNDLFTKLDSVNDPSIPSWALLLFESFKVIITELKVLNDVNKRINILEDINATSINTTDKLKTENARLNDVLTKLQDRVDDHEQRNRNLCLLMHGVEEGNSENTDDLVVAVINNDLGIDITVHEIERSHRLGPINNRRNLRSVRVNPRPIILRFNSFRKRQKVFKAKRSLKGKKVSLSENLTKQRYEIYKAAVTKYGRDKVWTNEGRTLTKVNNTLLVINSLHDLS